MLVPRATREPVVFALNTQSMPAPLVLGFACICAPAFLTIISAVQTKANFGVRL